MLTFCVCVRCTALVTHGLRQSVSGGRESLRWVGLKTSDAWLRGPGSSSRRLLLLSVWVCVSMCVFMCVRECDPEAQRDCVGQSRLWVSGKTQRSDKSSSVPCSVSVCCLGCNTLLRILIEKKPLKVGRENNNKLYVDVCVHVQSKSYLITAAGRNTLVTSTACSVLQHVF